jgi:hypothetical protein
VNVNVNVNVDGHVDVDVLVNVNAHVIVDVDEEQHRTSPVTVHLRGASGRAQAGTSIPDGRLQGRCKREHRWHF